MEREYPYEHCYFGWMVEWSALADSGAWDFERWNAPALARRRSGEQGDGLLGPPPWESGSLSLWAREADEDGLGPRLLLAAWREFSAQAAARTRRDLGSGQVRFHAEKALNVKRLRELSRLAVPAVVLHRDPRDVWLSVQSFNRARGYPGFGRRPDEGEEEWLERFLADQAQRMRAALAERGRSDSLLVAYKDLLLAPAAVAAQLRDWLGLELDPTAPARRLEDYRHHATSPSAEASVDRWRHELEPQRRERFAAELGPELRELGYEA